MNTSSSFPPALPAPVERRHRLAVLLVQGFSEQWLAERKQHLCARWLEQGEPVQGNNDKLAQAMADFEAAGRQDREAYVRGLRQILDRIDRAVAEEVGQPAVLPVVIEIPWDLKGALERLALCKSDGIEGDINEVDHAIAEVVACFRKHQVQP